MIGIDPGTRITGYGIICLTDTRKLTAIDYGCIRPPPTAPLSLRYRCIFKAVTELIQCHKPIAVAVETQFVQKNPASAVKLSMARAAVMLAASLHEIPLFAYAPTKAKLAVVGRGLASKQQVQSMIRVLLSLPHDPAPEDAADALALAICHAHTYQSGLHERFRT